MTKNLIKSNVANMVSAIALLFTWLAIIFLLKGRFYFSYGLILLAFVFDTLDGYFARKLSLDNKLGRAIDGYIDTVNYLIYPALAFVIFFNLDNLLSIICIFIFLATGIFRLARFEVSGIKRVEGQMFYEGLPVIIGPVIVFLLMVLNRFLSPIFFVLVSNVVLLLTSFLMVQTFNFPKPKILLPILFFISVLSVIFLVKGSW